MKLMVKQKLESLLTSHWTDFLDTSQLMKTVLEIVRDFEYKVIKQQNVPTIQTKISVTKINVENTGLEAWIEFSVPKEDGVVIGTHVIIFYLSGEFDLLSTHGTLLKPMN